MLNVPLDVVVDTGDREHQGFLEAFLEAYPLPGVKVLIEGVIKSPCT